MRFLFLPSFTIPIHAKILEERPLGGTETGVVRLAAELAALGHEVTVLTQLKNPPLSNPLYLPMTQLSEIDETDVLIVVREWRHLFCNVRAKKRLFWSGDAGDQPGTLGLGDKRVSRMVDAFLAVSKWQAKTVSAASGFPDHKMRVIRNGIHEQLFAGEEQRNSKRLIYSSTPYRGLAHMPRLFARIKAEVPDAELAIFSGYDVYADTIGGVPEGYDQAVKDLEQLKQEFAKIPGIIYSGSVAQKVLARQFMRSAVLAYPNTFAETSCITVMEAQRAGCVPLTSRLGALNETVGTGGVLINGQPGEPEYDARFVKEAVRLLTDTEYWNKLSLIAQSQAEQYSWKKVAERLLEFI